MTAHASSLADSLDFESYADAYWTVNARDSEMPIPFIFNPPQRIMEYEARKMRLAGKLIRIKAIKLRQGGISTYSYNFV